MCSCCFEECMSGVWWWWWLARGVASWDSYCCGLVVDLMRLYRNIIVAAVDSNGRYNMICSRAGQSVMTSFYHNTIGWLVATLFVDCIDVIVPSQRRTYLSTRCDVVDLIRWPTKEEGTFSFS